MHDQMAEYLRDPLVAALYRDLTRAGPLRAILVDITHRCNLRCKGCYFFAEEMDALKAPKDEAVFDEFLAKEKARGTNFVTVVGGEPSLELGRVKKLYDNFWVTVISNGIRKIPVEGFENLPVGLSVWGDHETDRYLRGNDRIDVFRRALRNYRDDRRAIWYFTTTPKNAHEVESVVGQCVDNGNFVSFNFYGDVSGLGGGFDHRLGFDAVRREIDRAIERYPDRILSSSYIAQVVSTGKLFDETWGYDVCCSVTADHPMNADRTANGNPYNRHFRAYNPDLVSTRRCCIGNARDCDTCFDVYAHISWIMIHLQKHLRSRDDFVNWLVTLYLFYVGNRIVDFETGIGRLAQIHAMTARSAVGASPSPVASASRRHLAVVEELEALAEDVL